jgi:hypothetical protein
VKVVEYLGGVSGPDAALGGPDLLAGERLLTEPINLYHAVI